MKCSRPSFEHSFENPQLPLEPATQQSLNRGFVLFEAFDEGSIDTVVTSKIVGLRHS